MIPTKRDGSAVETNDILNAMRYIDEHGYHQKHAPKKYKLGHDDERRYPIKYTYALAAVLADADNPGEDVIEERVCRLGKQFWPNEVIPLLENMGFTVEIIGEENN